MVHVLPACDYGCSWICQHPCKTGFSGRQLVLLREGISPDVQDTYCILGLGTGLWGGGAFLKSQSHHQHNVFPLSPLSSQLSLRIGGLWSQPGKQFSCASWGNCQGCPPSKSDTRLKDLSLSSCLFISSHPKLSSVDSYVPLAVGSQIC